MRADEAATGDGARQGLDPLEDIVACTSAGDALRLPAVRAGLFPAASVIICCSVFAFSETSPCAAQERWTVGGTGRRW
jgi:hypothetical protein